MKDRNNTNWKYQLRLLIVVLIALFGVAMFFKLTRQAAQWKTYQTMVAHGDLIQEQAHIIKLWKRNRTVVNRKFHRENSKGYRVQLATKQNLRIQRSISARKWGQLELGDKLTIYKVDSAYYIPEFDLDHRDQSRWFFLAISFFSLVLLLRTKGRQK